MGIPILSPNLDLLPFWFSGGYASSPRFAYARAGWNTGGFPDFHYSGTPYEDLRFWASLSDMVKLPHILHWGSIAELLDKLTSSDLVDISTQMRMEASRQMLRTCSFWASVLVGL